VNTPVLTSRSETSAHGTSSGQEYEFIGNRQTGNCTLRINRVRHHDEGNWRYVRMKRNGAVFRIILLKD